MKDLKHFDIPFAGLREGSHLFEYQIDNKFFEAFQFDDFNDANVKVDIKFVKKSTFLELTFTTIGTVNVPCDSTNEPYNQEINATSPLLVKFGTEFNNEHEEILMLPHEAYQINVAQYIYETIVLAVPTKRIHPKVLDGTMKSEAFKKLKELTITVKKTVDDESIDPRWDKSKSLITEKKT